MSEHLFPHVNLILLKLFFFPQSQAVPGQRTVFGGRAGFQLKTLRISLLLEPEAQTGEEKTGKNQFHFARDCWSFDKMVRVCDQSFDKLNLSFRKYV